MTSLFRSEAIDHQRQRLYGRIVVVQPLKLKLLVSALASMGAAAFLFAALGTYSRTEKVQGFIAPRGGMLQVYATRGGTISAVLVREGDHVEKDAPVAQLSLETSTTHGSSNQRVRVEAEAKRDRVRDQMAAAEKLLDGELVRLQARAIGVDAEIHSISARLEAAHNLLSLQNDDAARYAELAERGVGSRIELSRRQQLVLTQRGNVHELRRQYDARKVDRGEIALQIDALPVQRKEKLARLLGDLSDTETRLAELESAEGYVLLTPVAGTIAALQVSVGTSINSTTPAIALVPDGSGVEAQLLVPSRSAGLLKAGQEVRVRVDAYPFQRFGVVDGRIDRISTSTFAPGELLAPIKYQEPMFRAVVTLSTNNIRAYGEDRPISPGMTLNADVIIERVSFLDRILDPLRAASGGTGRR